MEVITIELYKTVHEAIQTGKNVDLTGCCYEPKRARNKTPEYYHFLAGLAQVITAMQVLEIGTYYGGATRAIAMASSEDCNIVTLDIEGKQFPKHPNVFYAKGDSQSVHVVNKVSGRFSPPIDLLYLDSLHRYNHTHTDVRNYGEMLQPKFIVLDDIHINAEMKRVWCDLSVKFPACDLSAVLQRKCGFGIIQYRD